MIIRKLYRFEASHIVRNCSSNRCKYSIHGHSFRCELFLSADRLDRGQMVYDFGLLKGPIKDFLDGFDHATLFWEDDSPAYIKAMKEQSKRWVQLPVSPTAEQLSRVIFVTCQVLLDATDRANGDEAARVQSVILHETETGYAQCLSEDAYSPVMGRIDLKRVIFSGPIKAEWRDARMWEHLLAGGRFESLCARR
ncbi:MAG TPA: 6-carboxytetrahydropterin synthase QueD [Elusimicrobia bacterium]|nr:MAG: 6-carboxytetrahydropterin synthase QueD [Elusimicrobia bacterium GWA2_66_18]HAZ07604.1 6-carboxytetrahydropterin synthase QueD [Elusimicrobiota bacterium]